MFSEAYISCWAFIRFVTTDPVAPPSFESNEMGSMLFMVELLFLCCCCCLDRCSLILFFRAMLLRFRLGGGVECECDCECELPLSLSLSSLAPPSCNRCCCCRFQAAFLVRNAWLTLSRAATVEISSHESSLNLRNRPPLLWTTDTTSLVMHIFSCLLEVVSYLLAKSSRILWKVRLPGWCAQIRDCPQRMSLLVLVLWNSRRRDHVQRRIYFLLGFHQVRDH